MIEPISTRALEAAHARQLRLLKIPGSLGLLESVGDRLGAIQGTVRPSLGRGAVVVCCGDHHVVSEGVTNYPPQITWIQANNFLAGLSGINQVAKANDAEVWVVDAGIDGPAMADHHRLVGPRVRNGAGNIAREPAMSRDQCLTAIELGREAARRAIGAGATILAAGDMGIGNTTPAAALTAAYLGVAPEIATGRGSGLDDQGYARKVGVVAAALVAGAATSLSSGWPRLAQVRSTRLR